MPHDELLDPQSRRKSKSISSNAEDWGAQFLKRLEIEYTDLASELVADAERPDFYKTMLIAAGHVFNDSGEIKTDITPLLENIVRSLFPMPANGSWTREKNERRLQLIDKKIQQTITAKETVELARLTEEMRIHCDNESTIPLEGARKLHRRLLEMDDIKETSH